ncbi:hypothetical protein ES702_05686 [subsurface metagenome]
MRVRYWIIILSIIFIIGLVLGKLFLGADPIVGEYKIFRDLLTFILVIAGLGIALLGAVIYEIVFQNLRSEIKKKIKEVNISAAENVEKNINEVFCKFYIGLSYSYWKRCEPEDYKIKDEIKPPLLDDLGMAIQQSEEAIEYAEKLDKKKLEAFVCLTKNNLAYYLALRGFSDDSNRAISLAKYAYDRI